MKLSNLLFKFDDFNKFHEPQEFWCHACDQVLVKSDDPTTGVWFQASGHVRRFPKKLAPIGPGNFFRVEEDAIVVFAVCKECYGDFKYE